MSREIRIDEWIRPARFRAVIDFGLAWSPLVLVLAAIVWRFAGFGWTVGVVVVGAVALGLAALRTSRKFDRGWLVRRLDAGEAQLEDSVGLLFGDAELGPIQRLQAKRIASRLESIDPDTLVEVRPMRGIAVVWALALSAVVGLALWPAPEPAAQPLARVAGNGKAGSAVPQLTGQRVRIVPPAYTGLPPRYSESLDVRAPMGSRIEWTLAFSPRPALAALQLVAGQTMPLTESTEGWEGSLLLDVPSLYRITAEGMDAAQPVHRLEPIEDTPPQVRVVEPASGLVMMEPGQRTWRVVFEASDDYAVNRTGRLTITTAQGEGENVTFTERNRTVLGTGSAGQMRFAADLDLASFNLEPGSDIVAQLTIADTRTPKPQVVRGPGVILRWPSAAALQADGLDAMAKQVMPAYFRSQRQVIIDTEALIRERGNLSSEEFLIRSDTIGVDQRLLRLRYGQFVGMEVEEAPKPPPLPIADKDAASQQSEPEHYADDGHDHGPTSDSPIFGSLGDVTAEYGHTHDYTEAATLLDPDTRALLKAALDEMWQAELNLRSGRPEDALPYELRALDYIKQVQQATRIYLPRIGSSQPPIDMARRMTGKREGIVGSDAALTPFVIDDAIPATAWRALAGPELIDLDSLHLWVRNNSARIQDPLGVLAAIDAVRNAPNSRAGREKLRSQLWTVLTRPPAQVRRRGDGGVVGRRYTRGLR